MHIPDLVKGIKFAEEQKTLIISVLLNNQLNRAISDEFEGDFFSIGINSLVSNFGKSNQYKIIFDELITDGVIKIAYLSSYIQEDMDKLTKRENSGEDISQIDPPEHWFCYSNQKPKSVQKNAKFNQDYNEDHFFHEFKAMDLYYELDVLKAQSLIDDYLKRWETNEISIFNENIYNAKKQVEIISTEIIRLIQIENYAHTLFVTIPARDRVKIQAWAVMLFLEKYGLIDNTYYFAPSFSLPPHKREFENMPFKIKVNEAFFSKFFMKGEYLSDGLSFYMSEIKEPIKEKLLYFEAPNRIWNNDTEIRINKGGTPHEILNRSFSDAIPKAVKISEIFTALNITKSEFDKSVQNLRADWRKKFHLPKDEIIFEIKDNIVKIDASLVIAREKI